MKFQQVFVVTVVSPLRDGCGAKLPPVTAGMVRQAVVSVSPLASVTATEFQSASGDGEVVR